MKAAMHAMILFLHTTEWYTWNTHTLIITPFNDIHVSNIHKEYRKVIGLEELSACIGEQLSRATPFYVNT